MRCNKQSLLQVEMDGVYGISCRQTSVGADNAHEQTNPASGTSTEADKSAPTSVRMNSLKCIIAPSADYELSRNHRGMVNGRGTPVGPDVSRPAPILNFHERTGVL